MCNYLAFCDCSAFIFFVCLSAVFLLLFRLLFLQCAVAPLFFFAEIRLFEGKKSVFAQQQDVEKWCQNNRMNLTMEPKRETYICIYVYIYEQHQVHPWKIKLRSSIDCSWWSTKCGQPLVTMTVVRQHDRANRGRHGAERGRHGADTGQTGADTGQNSWSTNVTQNSWSKICNRCHHSFLGGDDSNALEHGKRLTWRCFVSGVFHAGGSKKAKI